MCNGEGATEAFGEGTIGLWREGAKWIKADPGRCSTEGRDRDPRRRNDGVCGGKAQLGCMMTSNCPSVSKAHIAGQSHRLYTTGPSPCLPDAPSPTSSALWPYCRLLLGPSLFNGGISTESLPSHTQWAWLQVSALSSFTIHL